MRLSLTSTREVEVHVACAASHLHRVRCCEPDEVGRMQRQLRRAQGHLEVLEEFLALKACD